MYVIFTGSRRNCWYIKSNVGQKGMIDRSSMKARSELKYKNILHGGERKYAQLARSYWFVQTYLGCDHQTWLQNMSQTVTFLTMQGNEVIVYLQNEYLPSLNVPPHMIQVKFFFFY